MKNPIQSEGEAMPTRPNSDYWNAWEKCHRLGKELSEALAEAGGTKYAHIRPMGEQHAVGFGAFIDGTFAVPELPVNAVDRLSTELAFALDDWAVDTNIKSVAHVYPASTERGIHYLNMKAKEDRETSQEAFNRLWDLLGEACRIVAARPDMGVDYVQVDENGAHWFHRIPGEARRPR